MRDIALTLFIAALLPVALWRPEFGAYLWAWISMMNPHKLAFGFANSAPWAYIIALVTLTGLLFSKQRQAFPVTAPTMLLLSLIGWMTVTSIFALNAPDAVWDRWLFVLKIHLMLCVTLMLIRGREQLDRLIWVIVVSIGFYGVKGGLWTIATGGGGRVWGPPGGMIGGNNELAVALVLLLPLMFYLQQTVVRRWLRWALAGSMVVTVFAILGTQSRGALLGLLAVSLVLGLKGRHPWRMMVLIGLTVGLAIVFMPDSWTSRMDTLRDYQADGSAMSRLYSWHTIWNLALDRPLVGAGFGTENPALFARYAPLGPEYQAVSGGAWVAHSIYFQALGEHGFVGLALYVALGLFTWRLAAQVSKRAEGDPELSAWLPLLMRMCQASLVGFASGAAFLSLMHFDVQYYVVAIVVIADASVRVSSAAVAKPSSRDARRA